MAAIIRGAMAIGSKLLPKIGANVGKIAGAVGTIARKNPRATATIAGGVIAGATSSAIDRFGGSGGGNSVFGLSMVTDPIAVEALRAPPGYVLVSNPDNPEEKIAVLKQVAYALGLRKRPIRGGITAHEIRAARKVQRVISTLTVARQPRFKLKKRGRR